MVAMMASASAVSMASGQQQPKASKFGTIASIQNGKNGKPEWILYGGWNIRKISSGSSAFNAGFNMVMLNGRAPHTHSITDFKTTGSPTKKAPHRRRHPREE